MSDVLEEGPGFYVERTETGTTLVACGKWSVEADRVLGSGAVDALDLNYAKGFKDPDLAFVREWPIKRLTILARTIQDLTPIYCLASTLEALSVQSAPSATLDLARFPALETLSASWAQVRSSIGDLPRLRDLYLGSYSEIDLSPLRWNSQLVRLRMKDRPSLRTLGGIEYLPLIEHLGIYLAPLRNITSLADIDGARLRELHLESCPIMDLGPVARLSGLRLLNASDCRELHSLLPLARLEDLEVLWLYGTTKILDDDLAPIAELPRLRELRMKARRSYQPSVEEIQAAIEGRSQE